MHVGLMEVTLNLPAVHSLKEKRSVVKRLVERSRHRFQCASAEVDALDLWQRAVVGFAVVGNDARFLNERLDKIRQFVEQDAAGMVVDVQWAVEQY